MFRAADSAISGMREHQLFIDTTGNNIANVNSDGYKSNTMMFEDTLNEIARANNMTPPQPNGAINPAMVGLGVATRNAFGSFQQGAFLTTNKPTDVAVGGAGYFVLQGRGGERTYTRNGNFTLDATGTLRAGDGKAVLGTNNQPIRIPNPAATPSNFSIDQRGRVTAQDTQGNQVVLGTIQLARFASDRGLERIGNSEFRPTQASGAPIAGQAGADGRGSIYAGVVEGSNVDLGRELTNLIMAQRGFSANSKVLSTMDELADSVNQIRR